MPGGIVTDLQRYAAGQELIRSTLEMPTMKNVWKSAAQDAATQVWAAVGRDLEKKGGVYLENYAVAGPMPETQERFPPGYAHWAMDPEKEDHLWDMSLKMVGWNEE